MVFHFGRLQAASMTGISRGNKGQEIESEIVAKFENAKE
jgi:hypothetical protein